MTHEYKAGERVAVQVVQVVQVVGDLMQDAVKKSAVAEAAWKENKANPTTKEGEGS